MANIIKDFFNKKKLDVKFKKAGTGHTLSDSASNSTPPSTASASTASPSGSASNENRKKDLSTQKAAEAAIERIQKQQTKYTKTNTLETILREERQKISEEAKMKEKVESLVKEEEKFEKRLLEIEAKQRFSCPTIGINEWQPIDILMQQIEDYIEKNFAEDMTLMSALKIINCNYSLSDDHKQRINDCISTLDKVVTNLANSTPEEREKFRKIRKSKIEKRVLDLKGGYEFLLSIGFESNSDGEWLVFNSEEIDISEQMNYYRDVLTSVQQFPIVLDRQCALIDQSQPQNDDLSNDFFKLSTDELMREYQSLTEKREMEETLRTKAMREHKLRKINYKFSRLRFKFGDGSLFEATFKTSETLTDVKNWLLERFESLDQFDLKCAHDIYTDQHMDKTLKELNLMPAASLLVIAK